MKLQGQFYTFRIKAMPLVLLLLHQGLATFLTGNFQEDTNSGKLVRIYKTDKNVKYLAQCAMICLENTSTTPFCVAFKFNISSLICDLFSTDGNVSEPPQSPGLQLFWFQVTDVFHKISIRGEIFSIYVSSVQKNFAEARVHCQDLGAYLLEFDSMEEYEAAQQVVDKQVGGSLYVGAQDIENEGQWITDRDGRPISSELWKWAPMEPNGYSPGEDCAAFEAQRLNDYHCSVIKPFLCERDL